MIFTIAFTVLIVLSVGKASDHPEVKVPGVGTVVGWEKTTAKGEKYTEYHDVPYAHVSRDNLFQPATPAPDKGDELVNPTLAPFCPGWNDGFFSDISNCLVMTIYTKNHTSKSAVIVYFTGFNLVPNQLVWPTGKYILTEDVVLVAAEYRVGPYGFLSTLSEEIPGNAGLLDAIESLKWVQRNIEHFGGDPGRVTLMGHNFAAAVIGALTHIPKAEGLFHQVIYNSGSPILRENSTPDSYKVAKIVGERAGCVADEPQSLTQCLLRLPEAELMTAYKHFWQEQEGEITPFTLVDPNFVIPTLNDARPYPTIGGFVHLPIIHLLEEYSNNSESIFTKNSLIQEGFNTEDRGKFQESLARELDKKILPMKKSILQSLASNKAVGADSFLYVFAYEPSRHYFAPKEDSLLGDYVGLCDDYFLLSEDELTGNDRRVAEHLVQLFTSFAQNGVPTTGNYSWPKLTNPGGPFALIHTSVTTLEDVTKEFHPSKTCLESDTCKLLRKD